MHLPKNPNNDQILELVEQWIDDLASGEYEAAFSKTERDPYYKWTPALIREVFRGYGLPEPHPSEEVFAVTSRKSAVGNPPQQIGDRENVSPPVFAEVWYDLPLNGKWSDLTATFRIENRTKGSVIILQEIHVF